MQNSANIFVPETQYIIPVSHIDLALYQLEPTKKSNLTRKINLEQKLVNYSVILYNLNISATSFIQNTENLILVYYLHKHVAKYILREIHVQSKSRLENSCSPKFKDRGTDSPVFPSSSLNKQKSWF